MDAILGLIIVVYSLTATVSIILSIYSIINFIKNPISTFLWLSGTSFTEFLAAVFEILSVISTSERLANLFIRLAYESFAITLVLLIFFAESYTQKSMRIVRITILAFTVGFYSHAFLDPSSMELKNEKYNLYDYSSTNWQLSILAIITFFLVSFWILSSFAFAYNKVSNDKTSRRKILTMASGFILAAIVTPIIKELWFQIFTQNLYIQALMAGVMANTFLAVGTLMLVIPYLHARSIQFLLPQNYYYLIVVNEAGIMLWEHRYQKHHEMEGVLLSAALIAIRSLLQDATGFESPLKTIQFQDITFVLAFKEQIAALLILDHGSQYIERQLQIFASRFYDKNQEMIKTNTWRLTTEIAEEAKKLMKSVMLTD